MRVPCINWLRLCRVCVFLFVAALVAHSRADTVYFDNFNDGDAEDGMPVTWTPFLGGTYDASSGDYVLTPAGVGPSAGSAVLDLVLPDTSIRAQGRILESSGPGGGTLQVFARGNLAQFESYLGSISGDGRAYINRPQERLTDFIPTDLRPLEEDILLQLDVVGTTLSLWGWRAGEPMPGAPLVTVDDGFLSQGATGIAYAAGSDANMIGTAVFRFVHVADMPIRDPVGQVLSDDFNDGDDDGWTRRDRTTVEAWGPGTFDASSGAYHFENGSLAQNGPRSGLLSTWDGSADPVYSDGFLRATVRADNDDTFLALSMRATDTEPQLIDGYLFGAAVGGRFQIYELFDSGDGAGSGPIVSSDSDTRFTSGEDWIFEAGAVGDELSFKFWRDGEPEPVEPQLVTTSSTFSSGLFGVEANVNGGLGMPGLTSATFDNIYFRVPQLPGDYDDNGTVGPEDYDLWKSTYGSTANLAADGNHDGIIGAADYVVWRNSQVTNTAQAAAGSLVPEPSTLVLLALTVICMHRRCQRARSN